LAVLRQFDARIRERATIKPKTLKSHAGTPAAGSRTPLP
jgi:hypothetical protein